MDDPTPWHEDEEFWTTVRPFVFPPETIERAPEQVDRVTTLLSLEPPASVADVPTGVGRHAVELADRGFDVTAVDATSEYLDTARERAAKGGVEIEFVRADMRSFRRPRSFDAILNLYTSFGYFDERGDDERAARNFYASLKSGGSLAMSLTSKEVLAGKFERRSWDEHDGTYILEEREIDDGWNRIENRWIVLDDGDAREFTVSHRLYSAHELVELFEGVGFDDVVVYGGLDGSAYDEDADRLVAVARR